MAYQIARVDNSYVLLQQNVSENSSTMQPQMSFSTSARRLEDFEEMSQFHQSSPDSHFTRKRICSLAMPDGRLSLSDLKLIVTRDQIRSEQLLTSELEFLNILRTQFGVALPERPLVKPCL